MWASRLAIEHALLIAIWNMLTNGVFYQDLGGDYYTKLNPERTKQRALNQLRQMGYQVTLNPLTAAGRESSRQRATPSWSE